MIRKIALSLLIVLTQATLGLSATLSLHSGWNLVGARTVISDIPTTFTAPAIISCWKWNAAVKGWQVYLPKDGVDASKAYATSKGFALLEKIAPDDGFWLNVSEQATTTFPLSLPISGDETTASSLSLQPGWNLKAVTWGQAVAVGQTFADQNAFTSVWKWTGAAWAVYLPKEGADGSQTYAVSKGFSLLNTLLPNDGFWVNVGSTAANTDTTLISQPPLTGKVSEVVDKADKNTYKPLSGAEVWIGGKQVATTDSQGAFQTTSYGATVTIGLKKTGFVEVKGTFEVPESKQMYLFVQKQDLTSATLQATDGEAVEKSLAKSAADKPTPKVISSSDGTTSVQVIGMKLSKDITVAVTPYTSYNTTPEGKLLTGVNNPEVVAGGMVSMSDSQGKPTTNEEAGFSAQVSHRANKLLGKWTMEALEKKLASVDQGGKLFLFTKGDSGWQKAGEAVVYESGGTTKVKRLQAAKGVSSTTLHDFVFVLESKVQTVANQVSGKVIDSVSQQGVPGVFVSMDGVDTETVTDEQGAFSLAVKLSDLKELKLPAVYLYTWADGYYSAYQQLKLEGADLSALEVPIEKFAAMTQVGGKVTASVGGKGIANAKVTLKTPSVLSEIQIDATQVTTGKNQAATFKWQILDPDDWVTVKKTIQAKGKNTLTSDDVKSLLAPGATDIYFPISLEVTHSAGTATYVEKATGGVYYFSYNDGTQLVEEWWFDLSPDYSNFANLDTWTENDGSYQFYDIEEKLLPFLSASAGAAGFVPTPFDPVPAAQDGVSVLDFSLVEKPASQGLTWNFDSPASLTGWGSSLSSQGQPVTSPIGWKAVTKAEDVTLSPKLTESVYQADAQWKDEPGTIVGPITIDPTQSDAYYKTATAELTFSYNGQPKTIPVLLYDTYDAATDSLPDGFYDWLEVDYNKLSTSDFYLWYDAEANANNSPAPYDSYHLQEGGKVTVSYLGAPTVPHLLAAVSGETAFWVGNQGPGYATGTYYDPKLPVSTTNPVTVYDAVLESPEIDLKNFSQATLRFQGWFEVNGDASTYSSLTVEVALVDQDVPEGGVILESAWAQTTVKKGEYLPLVQYNPNAQWFSGVGPLAKKAVTKQGGLGRQRGGQAARLAKIAAPSTALRRSAGTPPKAKALLDSVVSYDVDGDGMDDNWEAGQSCAVNGHLDPLADADGDNFLNLEEFYDATDPCDPTSMPVDADANYLLDSWEAKQSCQLLGGTALFNSDDHDGDGFSDFDEFTLLSDPCDPNSPGDVDQDGLPDTWEAQWSCAVAGDLDPLADPDVDGVTTKDEYLAMTDPCSGIPVPPPFSGWPLTSNGDYTTPSWVPEEFNLSPYVGHRIKLRYTFSFANSPQNLYRGAGIDDVRVLDEESYKDFELLTPDFGYYGPISYQPVATGTTLGGSYTLAISNGWLEALDGSSSPWTPADQSVSVAQDGLHFTTTITFAGKECLVDGWFTDESYTTSTYYFTDTATSGNLVSGWGDTTSGPGGITGTIAGFDWDSGGLYYWGDIQLQ